MRTFHSGGILSSFSKKQLKVYNKGQIIFPSINNYFFIRTNKGEYYQFFTKNIVIQIKNYINKDILININKNVLFFVKNKTFVKQNQIIGEIPLNQNNLNKTLLKKNIYSLFSGRIFYPNINFRNNIYKVIWFFPNKFLKINYPVQFLLKKKI